MLARLGRVRGSVGQTLGVVRVGGRVESLRPFWMHQVVEYLLGLMLVAQGLQSPTPAVPALAGGVVVLNAAIVEGPLAAFRTIPRRFHRWADVVLIGVLLALAALPALNVDNTSRLLLAAVAVILGVVWWNTSFERRAPSPPGQWAEQAAGRAGRAVGSAARAVRQRRDP